jgi:hypothetical protein
MEKPLLWQTKILTTENKREYLELMEEMHERRARQLEAREVYIRIKEMHAHMGGTELEQEEEELQEHEEGLKKREEELLAHERELEEQMKKSCNDYWRTMLCTNCALYELYHLCAMWFKNYAMHEFKLCVV